MQRHILLVLLVSTLLALGISGCGDDDTPQTQTVATPVISPSGGIFTEPLQVTITSTTSNALIYYTLDGTDPTLPFSTAQVYSNGFTIDSDTTINAYAALTNWTDSAVATAIFSLHYSPTNDFEWTEAGGEVTITNYVGNADLVYIPETINGSPVTFISNQAFQGNRAYSITIPDSVRTIGKEAFSISYNLTNVSLPASLTNIGDRGFWECKKLPSITLPTGLTHIGFGAFRGCELFTTLSIPASVISIGSHIANECPILSAITVDSGNTHYKSVDGVLFSFDGTLLLQYPAAKIGATYTIPDGVETVGMYAFANAQTLISLTMPDSVTTVEEGSFRSHTSLQNIVWSANLTTIGKSSFYNTGLTNTTLPASLTTIGHGAFGYVPNLVAIQVAAGNTAYADVDGVLLNAAKTTLFTYPHGKTSAVYSLPPGVETIAREAFASKTQLTEVTIPDTVNSIESAAFFQCTNLIKVTVQATTPPTLVDDAQFVFNAPNRKFYVPAASVGDYQTAWSDYSADIEPIP